MFAVELGWGLIEVVVDKIYKCTPMQVVGSRQHQPARGKVRNKSNSLSYSMTANQKQLKLLTRIDRILYTSAQNGAADVT